MIHIGHKSYWFLPLFSALMWLGMLLGMLLWWLVDTHSAIFPSEDAGQHIAYISDVGAQKLKPLFITGSTVTVVLLDLSMLAERWLRHSGRLAPNTSWWQKSMSILAIIAGIAGALGIILLSIFDTLHYPTLHDRFLVLFIVGYVLSAIFICAEYGLLGSKHKSHPVLAASFWIKLAFIIVEVGLAIAFGVLNTVHKNYNIAAILEWIIAVVFTGYILTFFLDLLPAATKTHSHTWHTHGLHGKDDVEPVTEMRWQDDTGVNGNAVPASSVANSSQAPYRPEANF